MSNNFDWVFIQAVQIKFGSTSVIMSDTKAEESQQLFESIKSSNFKDIFWVNISNRFYGEIWEII